MLRLDVPMVTARLRIRRLVRADIAPFVAFVADPEASQYLAFGPEQRTPEGATAMVQAVIASYDSDAPIHAYAIADGGSDRYVGSVGCSPVGDAGGCVEVFYTVVPACQRRGYAREALTALAERLLASPNLTELRAYTADANVASQRTAQAAGFVLAGRAEHPDSGLPGLVFVRR